MLGSMSRKYLGRSTSPSQRWIRTCCGASPCSSLRPATTGLSTSCAELHQPQLLRAQLCSSLHGKHGSVEWHAGMNVPLTERDPQQGPHERALLRCAGHMLRSHHPQGSCWHLPCSEATRPPVHGKFSLLSQQSAGRLHRYGLPILSAPKRRKSGHRAACLSRADVGGKVKLHQGKALMC